MALTLTSELDAVNTMLGTIGESPISSLDGATGVVDAVTARQVLKEISIQVQEEGWHFNTEKNYELTPDLDNGYIYIPSNCCEVDAMGDDRLVDVAIRGTRLYDKQNHTFVFSKSLKCEMVLLLDWEDLPQAARHYIMIRAARVFQQRVVGSDTLNGFTQQDEARARSTIERYESKTADHNILTGNYDVMNIIDR